MCFKWEICDCRNSVNIRVALLIFNNIYINKVDSVVLSDFRIEFENFKYNKRIYKYIFNMSSNCVAIHFKFSIYYLDDTIAQLYMMYYCKYV